MKGFSLTVQFVENFAHLGGFFKNQNVIMGCFFNEITRFCSKNNVGFIYERGFFINGGAINRNKKSDILSVALFATLSQRQNMPDKFYFSVPF